MVAEDKVMYVLQWTLLFLISVREFSRSKSLHSPLANLVDSSYSVSSKKIMCEQFVTAPCSRTYVYSYIFFFTFLLVAVLGFELMASMRARQGLYHLCHDPSLFFAFSYILDRVLYFCLGLAWDYDHPTYVFCIIGITDMLQHNCLICWDRVLLTFCSGWPSTKS
jgi:hypothetical protein